MRAADRHGTDVVAALRHRGSTVRAGIPSLLLPRRMGVVATLEQPGEPEVRTYAPEEALRRSRPLPGREDLVVTDVPDDEWAAFQEALAET
jgi:hypothetical protein